MNNILVFLLLIGFQVVISRPSEQERVQLWHEAGNVWPPNWQPESDAFKASMAIREKEILEIPGSDERWENFMQFTQGRMVPTFTELGFEVVQIPESIYNRLNDRVTKAVEDFDAIPDERGVSDAIYGPLPPKFLDIGRLAWEAAEELKKGHEEWSGLELIPTSSYGIRMYQNGSSLVFHYDKVNTHVISSIVHIAHEQDEPWPIQIEDHDGTLHSVSLEPGQMLYYESAKCLHGRMTQFRGRYYASIFIHYRPKNRDIWKYNNEDVIASVPPHWGEGLKEDHGSRWAGQAITTDSRVVEGAPPRVVGRKFRSKAGRDPESLEEAEEL